MRIFFFKSDGEVDENFMGTRGILATYLYDFPLELRFMSTRGCFWNEHVAVLMAMRMICHCSCWVCCILKMQWNCFDTVDIFNGCMTFIGTSLCSSQLVRYMKPGIHLHLSFSVSTIGTRDGGVILLLYQS